MEGLEFRGHESTVLEFGYLVKYILAKAFLDEGWDAIGFDIEGHEYAVPEFLPESDGGKGTRPVEKRGTQGCAVALGMEGEHSRPRTVVKRYPGELILKSILEINGYDLRHSVNPALIVASPPCQEFSYMAMPWTRAKQIAKALRGQGEFPSEYTGSRTIQELTRLYRACFRIARECGCPIVLENVKGAQPWVGTAKANFGSYYLWGDVARIGNRLVRDTAPVFGMASVAAGKRLKQPGRNFHFPQRSTASHHRHFTARITRESGKAALALKTVGHANIHDGHTHARHLTNQAESDALTTEGTKQRGSGPEWFDNGIASHGSRSNARKAASAMIAEIPYDLAAYIARIFKPY